MFRYLRSRIGSSYEIKDSEQKDVVSCKKITTYGFPQRVSCFALSKSFGFLAIGTRDGRLQIYTPNCSQINIQIEFPIISVYFLDSSKTIIIRCNDLTKTKFALYKFFFYKIVNNELKLIKDYDPIPNEIYNSSQFFKCCKCLNENESSALLLGTSFGNIYTIWASPSTFNFSFNFQNTALSEVEELKTQQNRSITDICINSLNENKIVLLFNNFVIIVFDNAENVVLNKIVVSCAITSICNDSSFQSFFCSFTNGFYFDFNLTDENSEIILKQKSYFEGNNFTRMSKILISKNESFEQFVIFSGGVPDDLECQNPICIFCGDNSLILNFDSEIINFEIFEEEGVAKALFVLCQDELVAIDLKDSLWRMFSLPYLYPIHSSPVTCVLAISDISEQILSLFEQISIERKNSSKIFSSNKWPLEQFGGEQSKSVDQDSFLILTGHDNGNVCVWKANDLNFNLLLVCNTAKEFEGYQSEEENHQKNEENNKNIRHIPPIRKGGIFDPFSDDHRLCIQKIYFDSKSGTFAVGGQAGQLMVFETLWKRTSPANQLLLIDMTSGNNSENLKASESAIQPRNSPLNYEHGFCLYNNVIAQFKPPIPVTAISWNFNLGVLAAGNEFGYAVCSIRERKLLLIKTLMSSQDVLQISNKDSALSRFKSVKKSIRQSFRRKKQTAEQILENGGVISAQQNRHRQEREITQRSRNPNALDGETPNSLIKILNFETCILSPFNTHQEVYLFVGTQGGAVLIHLIRPDACVNTERCQLIKEIRLRHHAPIAAIELLHNQPNSRLLIFSEEQIRSFTMPNLKSFTFKYRLTAIEGSRIRKATTVLLNNEAKKTSNSERFLAVTTNRGEIFFISPTNPKCLHKISFVQPNNTIGIFSTVITRNGQIFYLNPCGSEFIRLGSHLTSGTDIECNIVETSIGCNGVTNGLECNGKNRGDLGFLSTRSSILR
uniref:Lethal giant larvae homologue 2 domain-containing protein n=1 Tax=Meloidogyne incognita TaxID=6306 RepID=A0A914LUU3_MELIC